MVAQGGFNRTAVLVHVLAIAAGLFAGWFVMDRITPDFPTDDPGVESSSAPAAVSVGALHQLDHQTVAGTASCACTSRRAGSTCRVDRRDEHLASARCRRSPPGT